jgi:hypothetical protein
MLTILVNDRDRCSRFRSASVVPLTAVRNMRRMLLPPLPSTVLLIGLYLQGLALHEALEVQGHPQRSATALEFRMKNKGLN